jgi:hypothetical protein
MTKDEIKEKLLKAIEEEKVLKGEAKVLEERVERLLRRTEKLYNRILELVKLMK